MEEARYAPCCPDVDHRPCDCILPPSWFFYRVKWSDGSKGPANLPLENYSHGPTAPYNSWCLLQKEE